ncbi:MFS transporter [Ochrovirga pacifica]|uniref:MFS transporter n=1 Tax=Ochrovirga pacifica TaxID=1042376 RepID=UPI0002558B24|nr:MFS transporter [Ochrovirga pacifica]
MNKPLILCLIVLSQFFGTSLWFSSNAVLFSIAEYHHLENSDLLANLTIATQVGFILGSLLFAFFSIADRYKANWVFSGSILLAALFNTCITLPELTFNWIFAFRFLTGFFLAGVYPVGMKIAAYFFPKKVSNALGVLVGALVLGTAFPHFVASFQIDLSWKAVIFTSSILGILGSFLMIGLSTPTNSNLTRLDMTLLPKLFKKQDFRAASWGYFGHMWELYTFWTFVPLLISKFAQQQNSTVNTSFLSFITISAGALGCVFAGKLALNLGTLKVTRWALFASFFCCLLAPISLYFPTELFCVFLVFWGLVVVADSPLLSTLINQNSIPNYNGTALTISTSIGFMITIVSIALFNYAMQYFTIPFVFVLLALGPLISIWALPKK